MQLQETQLSCHLAPTSKDNQNFICNLLVILPTSITAGIYKEVPSVPISFSMNDLCIFKVNLSNIFEVIF